jgi:DNA gyrase/topoisomerase IV subunit A
MTNGATGIAVGMATNVPPHNLNEVCTALIKLLGNPDLTAVQLCRYVKGPDFPTGGQMLSSPRPRVSAASSSLSPGEAEPLDGQAQPRQS